MRIVVAMSGGVDSSVAAAMLVDAGHEVVGFSMQLYDQQDGRSGFGTCCTLDDLNDARRVAAAIGIPHYIVNFERRFRERVLADFVREYSSGRTPIPCVHCNADLKFATLLERARALGADQVATGHYAQVETDPSSGQRVLRRGLDRSRDQSYFLFSLDQAQLTGAVFPVGSIPKSEVREYARSRRLPIADKPESRELCFVPDGDYSGFIERIAPAVRAEGQIEDRDGRTLGQHTGVHRFTIGQRRGLGLTSQVPLYVLRLDAERQRVTVGPREALERPGLSAGRVNWMAGRPPDTPRRLQVQIRYQHAATAATVSALPPDATGHARAGVEFDEPQSAITPGQAVVFYDADVVVGGGWID